MGAVVLGGTPRQDVLALCLSVVQVGDAYPLHALGLDPFGGACQKLAVSPGWERPECFWTTYESGSLFIFGFVGEERG